MRGNIRPLTPKSADAERRGDLVIRRTACPQVECSALGLAGRSSAWKIVQRGLQRAPAESAEDLRTLEAARLDALQSAVWQLAIDGDIKATTAVLRIMERRARLLGLDVPSKQQVEMVHYEASEVDAQIEALVELLASRDGNGT